MLYPLYQYYDHSVLPLNEIIYHYVQHFYIPKHGKKKLDKIGEKIDGLGAIDKIFRQSIEKKVAPNSTDFCIAVNSSLWFTVQSQSTQVVAVLTAAALWNAQINSVYNIIAEYDFRKEVIKVFQKFSLYEEMSQMEFEVGAILTPW